MVTSPAVDGQNRTTLSKSSVQPDSHFYRADFKRKGGSQVEFIIIVNEGRYETRIVVIDNDEVFDLIVYGVFGKFWLVFSIMPFRSGFTLKNTLLSLRHWISISGDGGTRLGVIARF